MDKNKNHTNVPAIQTQNISKSFGELKAVDNLSLDIYPGEIFALLGPNGAGKTTTISILCGLLQADNGQVVVQGKTAAKNKKGVLTQLGVCPQEILIWERLSCLEQLEMTGKLYGIPKAESRQRAKRLLNEMKLSNKGNQLAGKLSGGMKRRLNLILALMHEPNILILDEPEAGLDPQSRVLVREFVRQYARINSNTVILTTHNMDEADRMADRVAIMDKGQLLVLDTPENLKKQIGENDVLEMTLPRADEMQIDKLLGQLRKLSSQITRLDRQLVLRGRGIINQLPKMIELFEKANIQPGEIKLRENTLEDVFIALTGRRLRE